MLVPPTNSLVFLRYRYYVNTDHRSRQDGIIARIEGTATRTPSACDVGEIVAAPAAIGHDRAQPVLTEKAKVRPNDARAVRSRSALRGALLDLIEQKGFDSISIKEITVAAAVSYPTFFRNYASKIDLLGEIGADEVRQLLAIMLSYVDRGDLQGNAEAICRYVGARRPLWTVLLNSGASTIMRDEFIELSRKSVDERGRINPDLPLEMVSAFVVGGLFEILAWWLREPLGFPASRVASFLKLLVLDPTAVPHDLTIE